MLCLIVTMFPTVGMAANAKFSVAASAVSASSDDGNVPGNTVDGDLNTRWSASGDGQWIQFDLGSNKKVAYLKIAFLNGTGRTSTFDIQTSTDNSSFSTVQTNVTSALADGLQTFDFPDVDPARYVRIVGHGNSLNAWNSYTEVEIYGDASTAGSGTVVNVTNTTELKAAITAATAGTTIVLANGTYSGPFSISKNGTASNPIVIKAANQGQGVIAGTGGFKLSNSSYITLDGLKFTNTGTAISLSASSNVRITRNKLALAANTAATKWIVLNGSGSNNNRIDHNEFGPRHDLGQMISIDGVDGQVAQYNTIEYNYFHDADPQTENGGETIRVGLSGLSMSDGFNTIQYNLFVSLDSDPEVISVKSKNNTVRYNTFRNNKAQVTARHGHNDSFYGNFFFGDGVKAGVGGFRIYGNEHKIYNNYFEKLTQAAINIDGGDFDAGPNGANYTSDDLAKHWRAYRVQVTNNTVVDSTSSSIAVGLSYTYAPVDSRIANNIAKSSAGPLYNEAKTSNTVFEGNIGYGAALDNVSRTSSEIKNVDPQLSPSGGLQKLTPTSPAVNASVGSYTYVTDDMDGQPRSVNDVGADEYSTSTIVRKPLTAIDVGPAAP
ncbi:chondroitinase-B domain-containing protein [Paenibacillus sp. RC67]|uniref:chondroitinase-B domain-containing protein n=1 Tax=Paenibacillus sp. RC67 TaxID=3039392 RepID=UPI0024AD8290|nr:chondroitinase-B domain-containing protein [Paenibacillus sp. RC67]